MVKLRLQYLLPSAGITGVAMALIESSTPCHDVQVFGALQGIEPCAPDCSGCRFRIIHHCSTNGVISIIKLKTS